MNHSYRSEEELKVGSDKLNIHLKGANDNQLESNLEEDEKQTSPPFSKVNIGGHEKLVVNKTFLKKYIAFAKQNESKNRTLSSEAQEYLS